MTHTRYHTENVAATQNTRNLYLFARTSEHNNYDRKNCLCAFQVVKMCYNFRLHLDTFHWEGCELTAVSCDENYHRLIRITWQYFSCKSGRSLDVACCNSIQMKTTPRVKNISALVLMTAVPLMNMSNAEIDTQLCHLYGCWIVVDFGFRLKCISIKNALLPIPLE